MNNLTNAVAVLKLDAVGYRTFFTTKGQPVTFKDGVCVVREEDSVEAIQEFVQKEGRALGISLMSEEDVKEWMESLQKEKEAKEAKAARQMTVDNILQGRDPQLLHAPTQLKQDQGNKASAAISVADRIAAAKAQQAAQTPAQKATK